MGDRDMTREEAKRIVEQAEQRRLKKNASLKMWRAEHREQYNEYIRNWRAKRTGANEGVIRAGRIVKPIKDTETGEEYASQAAAGRDLAHLIKGDPKNSFVWFELLKRFPARFRTRNAKGHWVSLDDPSAPVGTLRATDDPAERGAAGRRITTVAIDEDKYATVKALLRTATLRDTVDRAFDEVLVRAAREEEIARLQTMDGLDLDKPRVMEKAWH